MKARIQHIVQNFSRFEHNGLLLAAAILTLVVAGSWYKKEMKVRKIKLHITNTTPKQRLITKQDITRILLKVQQGDVKNLRVKDVDFKGLESSLEDYPSIQDAEVFLDMTNVLHIDIRQRIPIARIVDNNGIQYYMDAQGYRVSLSSHCSYRVPVVTGVIPSNAALEGEKLESPVFEQLRKLLLAIHNDKMLNALVEQVYVDAHDQVTLIPKAGYKRIFFGHVKDIPAKLDKLKKFYKKGDWGKYEMINLEYENLVFAKKHIKTT